MLRKGQTVTTLTPKVGVAVRRGKIVGIHDDFVDVEWEDGHLSTLTKESVVPVAPPKATSTH